MSSRTASLDEPAEGVLITGTRAQVCFSPECKLLDKHLTLKVEAKKLAQGSALAEIHLKLANKGYYLKSKPFALINSNTLLLIGSSTKNVLLIQIIFQTNSVEKTIYINIIRDHFRQVTTGTLI